MAWTSVRSGIGVVLAGGLVSVAVGCTSRALVDDAVASGSDEGRPADGGDGTPGNPSGSTGDPSTTSTPQDDGFLPPDFNDCVGDPVEPALVCNSDADCCSGICFDVPVLSNLCGQCRTDADCGPGRGCTIPNFLPGAERASFCNDGLAGDGCQTDAACVPGLLCRDVFSFDAFSLTLRTCGECGPGIDCGPGMMCGVDYDLGDFSGRWRCMPPGSLPLDQTCDETTNGDLTCASGICSTVDVEGLFQFGACGECNSDADCPPNQGCLPGSFDLGSYVMRGSRCG